MCVVCTEPLPFSLLCLREPWDLPVSEAVLAQRSYHLAVRLMEDGRSSQGAGTDEDARSMFLGAASAARFDCSVPPPSSKPHYRSKTSPLRRMLPIGAAFCMHAVLRFFLPRPGRQYLYMYVYMYTEQDGQRRVGERRTACSWRAFSSSRLRRTQAARLQ